MKSPTQIFLASDHRHLTIFKIHVKAGQSSPLPRTPLPGIDANPPARHLGVRSSPSAFPKFRGLPATMGAFSPKIWGLLTPNEYPAPPGILLGGHRSSPDPQLHNQYPAHRLYRTKHVHFKYQRRFIHIHKTCLISLLSQCLFSLLQEAIAQMGLF